MASEQAHGNAFERIVIAQSGLQFASLQGSVQGAVHDIPMHSSNTGVPISIKTAQSDLNAPGNRPTIALADAVRFYDTTTHHPLLMVIGLHHKTAQGPMVYEIHECHIEPHMQPGLWGDLTREDIRSFAEAIKTWALEDDHDGIVGRKRACEHARKHKRALLPSMGHVDLSPKISTNEARLQCAIPLYTLRRECLNAGCSASLHSMLHQDRAWRTIPIPLLLEEGNRTAGAKNRAPKAP